ncbi:MAG: 3-carboxy-cis,cis-muconate cycloisomerase [Pseudomonadota bacterium]
MAPKCAGSVSLGQFYTGESAFYNVSTDRNLREERVLMVSAFEHPAFGGLFDDPEANAIWSSQRQTEHFLAFEAAYSIGLGKAEIVEKDLAFKAATFIRNFKPDAAALRARTSRDGVPIPELVRQLKSTAPEYSEAIHNGATSQDVIDTALSLTIRDMNDLLAKRLVALSNALSQLNERFGDNQLMGRTRMQAALMTTGSTRITNWQIAVDENTDRLNNIRSRVEQVQLGGAVGDNQKLGDKFSSIANNIAEETRLNEPGHSWHTTRGDLAEYASLLSLISGATGKIGQDVCLMAQQGIDEIALSGGGGSSAMPHKQNPVPAELLITLARFNATQLSSMHHALLHEQERSGSAWALEWMTLPQMAIAASRSLSACTTMSGQITQFGNAKS